MSEGWILLYRQLTDSWVWQEKPFGVGQAWVDLLLLASWKERKARDGDQIRTRERGSVNVSKKWLADRWGWSRQKVDRILQLWEKDKMVEIESSSKGTHIRVINWDTFQKVPENRATNRAPLAPSPATDPEESRAAKRASNGHQMGIERASNGHMINKEIKEKTYVRTERRDQDPPSKEEVERRLAALRARRDQVDKEWRNKE